MTCRASASWARSASRSTRRRGCGTGRSSAACHRPAVDTWWQTETGQIMITTLPGVQDMKPGSAGTPLPGIKARVLDESSSEESERDKQGLLVLEQPWPGMLRTLFGDDDRYVETYFERFGKEMYLVGDAAREDEDDYFWIIG